MLLLSLGRSSMLNQSTMVFHVRISSGFRGTVVFRVEEDYHLVLVVAWCSTSTCASLIPNL